MKYNISRNIPLLKGKAQAAATSFTAMEHSLFQAENLIEKWEEVNTTPDEKLTTMITYLDRCLTTAKVCFHGYGKKNPLDAAMLNLKFLPDGSHNPPTRTFSRVQHILDTMLDEMIAQLSSEEPEAIASMPAEEEDADTRVDNISSPTHVDATYTPTRGEETPTTTKLSREEEQPSPHSDVGKNSPSLTEVDNNASLTEVGETNSSTRDAERKKEDKPDKDVNQPVFNNSYPDDDNVFGQSNNDQYSSDDSDTSSLLREGEQYTLLKEGEDHSLPSSNQERRNC